MGAVLSSGFPALLFVLHVFRLLKHGRLHASVATGKKQQICVRDFVY